MFILCEILIVWTLDITLRLEIVPCSLHIALIESVASVVVLIIERCLVSVLGYRLTR